MSATGDHENPMDEHARKVRHLDTFARESAERKRQVYARLQVAAGRRVLDVGCGVGADTVPLARLVGPGGWVAGVDVDPAAVAEADRRAAAAGVGAWVEHRAGDAAALPFPDATFDACHAERVFLHLADPEAVFAEMVRVTKPGGRIAVIDGDGATASFDTPEADIERRIVPFWIAKHRNGLAGRQLYRLFRQHGLAEVAAEVNPGPFFDLALAASLFNLDDIQDRALRAGAVTREEVGRFRASLERAAAAGTFFGTFNMITVTGHKP